MTAETKLIHAANANYHLSSSVQGHVGNLLISLLRAFLRLCPPPAPAICLYPGLTILYVTTFLLFASYFNCPATIR